MGSVVNLVAITVVGSAIILVAVTVVGSVVTLVAVTVVHFKFLNSLFMLEFV